uniref:Uncharacterized protein n=1 Tax=uncultured bacterium contig00097 TaxID=1181566 RepID=A0A806KKK3_9BACT|nr:hypothetical protein [uncultured bacterium contig00097]
MGHKQLVPEEALHEFWVIPHDFRAQRSTLCARREGSVKII